MSVPPHPGTAKNRKMVLLYERNDVDHKDMHPLIYRPWFLVFFPIMLFGAKNCLLLLLHLPAFLLFWIYDLTWLFPVGIATLAVVSYQAYQLRDSKLNHLIKRKIGLDHVFHNRFKSIKDEPFYHDLDFIKKAYSTSPYRQTLLFYAHKQQLITNEEYQQFTLQFNTLQRQYQKAAIDDAERKPSDRHQLPQVIASNPTLPALVPFEKNLTVYTTQLIFHQTIEGFCCPATFQTLLVSLPMVRPFPITKLPHPLSLDKTADYFAKFIGIKFQDDNCPVHNHSPPDKSETQQPPVKQFHNSWGTKRGVESSPFTALHTYHVDRDLMSFEHFQNILVTANLNNKRICVNFLRTPLFNPGVTGKSAQAFGTIMGHWSPVGSVIFISAEEKREHKAKNPTLHSTAKWSEEGQYYALILDVNHTYGAFLVPLYELYLSCYTKDEDGYRGFLVFDVDDKILQPFF